MEHISYESPKHIHFIGIGGISMSGLAEILLDKGFSISGSDMKSSKITERLEKLGVEVHIGHHENHITEKVKLIVYTAAIAKDNPELLKGKQMNIPAIERATLLGEIMANYSFSIGVSGTHGKTTTTSMLANILLAAKKDPTISVGGLLDAIDGNIKIGNSSYFLTEACEYCNSFLKFFPHIGIILNVDADHMDFFKDMDDIVHSFHSYAKQIKKDGYLIVNNTISQLNEITKDLSCKVVTCDIDNDLADFYAKNIEYVNDILPCFDIYHKGSKLGHVTLNVPGEHNVYNAVCAYATAHYLGISLEDIQKGLFNFRGTKKRFEVKGNLKGITIVDDYAHHPTEISATLKVANKYPHGQLWCVFQPHTYTRTTAFLNEFAEALSQADNIVLADIYAAREKDTGVIHSRDLLVKLQNLGKSAFYFDSFEKIENFLLENCSPGDLLITMGAGDISIVGEELLGL